MSGALPVVGVTMGDPVSIGPEIVVKALGEAELHELCRPVVVGSAAVLRRALGTTGSHLGIREVSSPGAVPPSPGVVDVLEVPAPGAEALPWGQIRAEAGRAAHAYIVRSIELALAGELDAVTTAPIHKEALRAAGVPQIGHTEIFGDGTGSPDPLTLFETRGLRVFFLSRHLSLAEAIRRLDVATTASALGRCAAALGRLGIERPRLALAALNPHGGEHGLFGDEEERILRPAVAQAREAGLDVEGPYPADSVFWQAAHGRWHAVLSLYHDQGHIATKMWDFERTVSLTLGLPFLRTSVDHGTAFDIAGTGTASAVSLVEAIRTAARYALPYAGRSEQRRAAV